MIVGGVHLDHAWTGLGTSFGSALRQWSRNILALVVEEANRRDCELLLIAGDLFNRSYALPGTIDYAAQVLGTFRGDVLIVPGSTDWYDAASLYSTHAWAANTSICSSSDYQPCAVAPAVWVSAWTSPGGSAPRVPVAPEARVLVRAGMDDEDRVLTVPNLVHDPREPGGFVLLIDSAEPTGSAQQIELGSHPGSLVVLDVTDVTSTDALAAALEAAITPGSPMLLRLVGTLATEVLLPGFSGPDRNLPANVVLDLDSLTFATPSVDPTDRSALAEFLRAIAYANTPELERHQTIALGLAALDDSAKRA